MSFRNQTELINSVNEIIENLNTQQTKTNLNKLKKLEKVDFKFLDQSGGKIMKDTIHILHNNYENNPNIKSNLLKNNYISSVKQHTVKGGGVTKKGDFTAEMKDILNLVGGTTAEAENPEDRLKELTEQYRTLHNEVIALKKSQKDRGGSSCQESSSATVTYASLPQQYQTLLDTLDVTPVDAQSYILESESAEEVEKWEADQQKLQEIFEDAKFQAPEHHAEGAVKYVKAWLDITDPDKGIEQSFLKLKILSRLLEKSIGPQVMVDIIDEDNLEICRKIKTTEEEEATAESEAKRMTEEATKEAQSAVKDAESQAFGGLLFLIIVPPPPTVPP